MKKKIYPRISTQLSAVITSEEGIRLKVVAMDASQYGFSFQCSTLQRNSLTPGGCFVHNGRPVELDVLLELPFPERNKQIKTRCHVAFSRRVASDKCELGIRYEDFEGDGYKDLITFIESNLNNVSTLKMPLPQIVNQAQLCA